MILLIRFKKVIFKKGPVRDRECGLCPLIDVNKEPLIHLLIRKWQKQTLLCLYHVLIDKKVSFFQQVPRHNTEKLILKVVADGIDHVGIE
jgi:hypothetical protein